MAYTHSKQEVTLTPTAASATATGDIGNAFHPGAVPHYVRSFSVLPITAGTVYTGVQVVLRKVDTTSGSTASDLMTVNLTATHVPGDVVMKTATSAMKVSPGENVYANLQGAASGTTVKAVIYVEPIWEQPANNADIQETT